MNKLTDDLQHVANTALMFIKSNLVATGLVANDYEDMICKHGDTVPVTLPGTYTTGVGRRPGKEVDVELSDWICCSFLMDVEERSKSFADIVNEYIEPAAIAMAESLDRSTLFWMAVGAGSRSGSPGGGFKLPNISGKYLIVPPKAQADLILDYKFSPLRAKHDGTALSNAALFDGQVYMDQNCPVVTTEMCRMGTNGNGVTEVMERREIGDMSLLFDKDSTVLACRPLPTKEAFQVSQAVSTFAGLSLRLTVTPHGPDPETEEVRDRFTLEMLTGVGVDPEGIEVIYS